MPGEKLLLHDNILLLSQLEFSLELNVEERMLQTDMEMNTIIMIL